MAGGDAQRGASPTSTRCRSTRGPRATSASPTRTGRRIARCISYSASDPRTTATPVRSRAWSRCVDLGARRGARGRRPRRRAAPAAARQLLPRRRRAAAHRPQAARDHPARGPELHGRRQPRALAAVVAAGVAATRSRASCSTPSATRTAAAPGRSCTAPRSARWSCPTATPARCTAGRTPSTPASGASAAWPTRSRSAATASARSTTSTRCSPTSRATRTTIANAICIHEEDYGILWKHQDLHTATHRGAPLAAPRRVSSIATVGNYEYGFYWYFYLDGTIQLEVKLTGIMSTKAVAPGDEPPHVRTLVAPGLAAPHHQHLFCARLDLDVDGTENEVYEVDVEAAAAGRRATRGATPSPPRATPLATRAGGATPQVDPARSRHWQIVNPTSRNRPRPAGRLQAAPAAHPDAARPPGLERRPGGPASPATTCGSRRTRRTSGAPPATTPTSTPAATGCRDWTAADRSLVDTDVVRLAHLRRHPRRPPRGLAGHAGRVRRLPARARSASSTATRRSTSPGVERPGTASSRVTEPAARSTVRVWTSPIGPPPPPPTTRRCCRTGTCRRRAARLTSRGGVAPWSSS